MRFGSIYPSANPLEITSSFGLKFFKNLPKTLPLLGSSSIPPIPWGFWWSPFGNMFTSPQWSYPLILVSFGLDLVEIHLFESNFLRAVLLVILAQPRWFRLSRDGLSECRTAEPRWTPAEPRWTPAEPRWSEQKLFLGAFFGVFPCDVP